MILETINDYKGCFITGTQEQCMAIAGLLNANGFRHDAEMDECSAGVNSIYFGGFEDKSYCFYSINISMFKDDLFYDVRDNEAEYAYVLIELQPAINA